MPDATEPTESPDENQGPAKQDPPKPDTPPKPVPGAPESTMSKTNVSDLLNLLGTESMLDMSIQRKQGTPPEPTPGNTQIPAPDAIAGQGISEGTIFPAAADSSLELKVGQMVHGYRIEANPDPKAVHTYIGFGASGVIYRARHDYLNRLVALKFLKKDDASPEELEQFKKEAQAIARLPRKNILQVYDFSEWEGSMFMAMELLEGGSAKERIKKQFGAPAKGGVLKGITRFLGRKKEETEIKTNEYVTSPQDIEYFVRTAIQVGEQLEIAHNNGILHRDIKPGNIMYRDNEQKEAVLVDYGLAVLIKDENTRTGGTPAFMAPEQIAEGELIDARTDVFGLGATLYNMLTGTYVHNFSGTENIEGLAAVIIAGTPRNVRQLNKKVDSNLVAIVHKAIAKVQERRYDSAAEFYEDLKRWVNGKSVSARPVTSFCIPTVRRLKKRGFMWLSTAAVSGALVTMATSLYRAQEPERMRNARVKNYIADINSAVTAADALRDTANKSYEALKQKKLIEMSRGKVDISELANHQKKIRTVFDSYSKALKLAEEWKKDDITPEKKSEGKRRELDAVVREFEGKNEYALQKVSAYDRIVEAMAAYKEHDFAKAEKELGLSLDVLYEAETQKQLMSVRDELMRLRDENNTYQRQRAMQGVRDVAVRVRAYRRLCRACFMDEIDVFSGSENEISPEKSVEWKKMMSGIEAILNNPEDAVLRKIQLDEKTYSDLIEQAKTDAQEAFYSEQSILKNKDVKHAIDMKRNRISEDKYVADLSEKYTGGKMDEEEYRVRMRLPLPSQNKFVEELESEFKKGRVSKSIYDKLKLEMKTEK